MVDLQLAEVATPDKLADHSDRLAERKLDGVRCYTENGRLHTRSGRDVTASFPEIDAPDHHILDGELVTADMEFESALRRVQTEKGFAVEMLAKRFPAMLVVFDVLAVNDGDVREKPLTERQELLGPSIPDDAGMVQATAHDDPTALWDRATAEGWEGIMLKDPDAPYRGGRGDGWLKLKDWSRDTFPIIDTETTENGGFVVLVEIGADEPQKVVVNGRDDQATVQNGVDAAEIQYLERSPDGRLRKPSFKGIA